jgi:hypothetical protein
MVIMEQFGIYIASYRRAKTATTHKFLEYYQYVVRKSEEEAYRSAGLNSLLAVEDREICGLTEVNQWLIDNAPEPVIVILDDDIHHFYYRLDKQQSITDPKIITAELERIAQLMVDLDVGFAATDATTSIWNYDCEFSFKGSAGAVRWINRKIFKAKCHKELEYNYDLDLVLQELLVNRIILKPKYFCSKGLTDVNAGGASDKQRADQIASIDLMRSKWGKYFSYNLKSNKPYIHVER